MPKTPPHSIEAEQFVIGGLLIDPDAWDRIDELVTDTDFYVPAHGSVFAAVRTLVAAAQPVDAVTVGEKLVEQGKLEQIGGLPFLAELAANTATSANIVAHAGIVRDRAVQRGLIRAGTVVAELGFGTDGRSMEDILGEAEQAVLGLAERGGGAGSKFRVAGDVVDSVMARIQEVSEKGLALTGRPSGFADLDRMTSGMEPGQLIIVAARPGMGKTAYAMNIAEHVAVREKQTVAVFNMEMPAEQLVQRMLCSMSRVDSHRVRTGQLNEQDWAKLTSSLNVLSSAPLYIDYTGGLSPGELRSRCRRLKREHGLGLVVVDYLQLMSDPRFKPDNRVGMVSEISRSMKLLAKELEVPVIALSQLNRALENRTDKRPMMADLRESGSIEQDADIIQFIYRDDYYNPQSDKQGLAEVNLGKQRNGPLGRVELAFLGYCTRFEDYTPNDAPTGYIGTFQ